MPRRSRRVDERASQRENRVDSTRGRSSARLVHQEEGGEDLHQEEGVLHQDLQGEGALHQGRSRRGGILFLRSKVCPLSWFRNVLNHTLDRIHHVDDDATPNWSIYRRSDQFWVFCL